MQNHKQWLCFAQEDLKAAKVLLKSKLFSSVTYHSQQSAEKALKAYLAFKKCPIVKTHDLLKLIELCMEFNHEFKKILNAAAELNPFSTKFRYPSEFDIPDFLDAKSTTIQALKIITFVIKRISQSEIGQSSILNQK